MRIAHVLTYVSVDGAFGGPLAVLSEQTRELARRGHHVEVFAGWDGRAALDLPGVDVHLFRVRRLLPAGFSGLVAPGLSRAVVERIDDFDVVHVHLARDLITTPLASRVRRLRPHRLFLQPHGMVKPDRRLRARALDMWVRPVLRDAAATFALTEVDRARLTQVEPSVTIRDLPNGVTVPPAVARPGRQRPEVLFLARLQARKRVLLFADAARRLIDAGHDADFVVVGPDEGDLEPLQQRIADWGLGDRIRYEGSVPPGQGRERMGSADIYVLPSLNEPFPMSLLEAMSAGTPTVTSSTCHIADRLGDAVVLFDEAADGGLGGLSEAIEGLLADPSGRESLGARGRAKIERSFSIRHVADLLSRHYGGGTSTTPPTPEHPRV